MIYWIWNREREYGEFLLLKVDLKKRVYTRLRFSGEVTEIPFSNITRESIDFFTKKVIKQNSSFLYKNDWKEITKKEYEIAFVKFQLERD